MVAIGNKQHIHLEKREVELLLEQKYLEYDALVIAIIPDQKKETKQRGPPTKK